MSARTTTLRAPQRPPDLAAVLARAAVEIVAEEVGEHRVLDTFDGRIARRGQQLLLRCGDIEGPVFITLRGGDAVPAEVLLDRQPATADDFPRGPLRQRIVELLGVRVLLPLLTVTARRGDGALRGNAGRGATQVAVATLDDVTTPAGGLDGSWAIVEEQRGYPGASDRVVEALLAAGYEPVDGTVFDAAAAHAGVDLAGTSIQPGIALDARMPAVDGFRVVLQNLRAAIAANHDGAVAALDPEFLHDLRIAVRRTRAVLGSARDVIPEDDRRRARDEFRWIGQLTGPARDLDVYQLEWASHVADLDAETIAALEPVREHLAERRRRSHVELATELAGDRAGELWSWWDGRLADESASAADESAADAGRPLAKVVRRRIRRLHRRMVEHGRAIDAQSPDAALHELRKDAKQLRGIIECFGGLYDPRLRRPFVKRLKAMQDNLGEHQDAAVQASALVELAERLAGEIDVASLLAIGRLVERTEQRRIASRYEFAERFAGFDSDSTATALERMLESAGATGRTR